MESSFSKPPTSENNGGRPSRNPNNYEMFANETFTKKKDTKKKKVQYRTNSPNGYLDFPSDELFQIPESDKNRQVPALQGSGNPKYSGNKRMIGKNDDFNCRVSPYDSNYNSNVRHPPGTGYDNTVPGRNPSIGKRSNQPAYVERDQSDYDPPATHAYSNQPYKGANRGVVTDLPSVDKNPSLICKAINYDGEPVTVNNEVVRDKLILSCRPRTHYGVGRYSTQPPNVASEMNQKYGPQIAQPTVVDSNGRRTSVGYHETVTERREYTGTGRLEGSTAAALQGAALGIGEHGPGSVVENQYEKYEEEYRTMQCKRYRKNFKVFLWALFIINLLLLLVGLALLFLCLYHILFKSYVNVVIEYSGFAFWIFGVFILALLIIFVATYGIITAMTRSKRMLCTYIIFATILAITIFIWLLLFWILQSSIKTGIQESMSKTFDLYRCQRNIRIAWDDLHEVHQCCGKEGSGDWKYIPPSCCQGQSRFQKQGCIGHFIQEEQAFKGGCRTKLEDYFVTMFLLITCLLVLAIILLLLGVLAALRLLKMYKIILKCREMYLITP